MTDLSELTAAERKRRAPWELIKADVARGLPWREIAEKHGEHRLLRDHPPRGCQA